MIEIARKHMDGRVLIDLEFFDFFNPNFEDPHGAIEHFVFYWKPEGLSCNGWTSLCVREAHERVESVGGRLCIRATMPRECVVGMTDSRPYFCVNPG